MPETFVPWGDEKITIDLPAHWRLQQVAEANLRPAADDWPDRLARALSQSGNGDSLPGLLAGVRNGRVVIIVEDLTRHSPLPEIMSVLLREIRHAGIDDGQIEVFFANGMHPPLTTDQAESKLGGSCGGIAWRCNQYDNAEAYTPIGEVAGVPIMVDSSVAQADLRIIVSSVSPHLQAGFGGGFKMIFPGCAYIETIRSLHRKGLGRKARQLVGTDVFANPMRRVIDAAGTALDEFHGRTFAVQYILDDDNLPTISAAGEVLATHRMMAKQSAVASGVVVDKPADVLITNAFPRDFDLWQSFKCIANTRYAARPNGVIICLTRCQAALGGMKVPRWPLSPAWTRRIIRWLGSSSIFSLLMRMVPSLAGDAAFFVRMGLQTIERNPMLIVSSELFATGAKFPGLHIFENPADAIAAADDMLGDTPQRVVVFPSGGTTYPVPSRTPRSDMADNADNIQIAELLKVLEITRAMAATEDLDKLLTLVIDRGMELLAAERATVFLYQEDTHELVSRVAAGTDEIRIPADVGIAGAAAKTGQVVNIPDAYADERFNSEVDKQTGFRTRNILSVPMNGYDGKLVGVLQLLNYPAADAASQAHEIMLAETLAAQAGVAIQRAGCIAHYLEKQQMERAMKIAQEIQRDLLPDSPPQIDGFDIAGFNKPADETGGDTYDFLTLGDGRCMVTVADATGHGIGPALVIAETRAILRAICLQGADVPRVLDTANNLLVEDLDAGRFVTCFLGVLDSAACCLHYASAGHGPMLFYTAATGEFDSVAATSIPLGVMEDAPFDITIDHELASGDFAVIFTDGFIEAANADGDEYGVERAMELLAANCDKSAADMIATLHQAVGQFTAGQPQADDLTAVIIKKS